MNEGAFARAGLSRKARSRKENAERAKTRVTRKELSALSLAIIDGNEEEAEKLSKSATEAGLSVNHLLKACYEGAKAVDKRYAKGLCGKANLIMAVEAFRAALIPIKERLRDTVEPRTIVLGAMESDGEWCATAYTLPLLKAFGHKVLLVASFYPGWYIEEIRTHKPNVVCLTCIRPSARYFIKEIIEGLKKAGLYDAVTCLACGTYLTKREASLAGCHRYSEGYLQIPQVVNDIIKKRRERESITR